MGKQGGMTINIDAIRMRLQDGADPMTMPEVAFVFRAASDQGDVVELIDGTQLWPRREERRYRLPGGFWCEETVTTWHAEPRTGDFDYGPPDGAL
jgi:hypothetical protein